MHYSLFFFSLFFFAAVFLLLYIRNDNFLIVSIGLEILYIVLSIFFCSHSIMLDDLFYFWLSFCCIVLGAIDTAISLSLFSYLKQFTYFLVKEKVFVFNSFGVKNNLPNHWVDSSIHRRHFQFRRNRKTVSFFVGSSFISFSGLFIGSMYKILFSRKNK